MPFVKGQPRHPNAGRKRGVKLNDVSLTIKLPEPLLTKFKEVCKEKKLSQAKVIRSLMMRFIEEHEEVSENSEEVFKDVL